MKKVILFLLLILTCSAKSQWIQYPSSNFGGALYFVQFITNIRGFFGGICSLGGLSIVFETYDGGPMGVIHNTYTTFIFYDFNYINSNNIFLVGSQKSVLKSFTQIKTTGTGNFYSISNPSINIGYVVGDSPNNISKSTNGGENWATIISPTALTLKGVYFINDLTGWISGQNGTLYKTTSGGATWIQQNLSSTYNLEKIFFMDSVTGIVVGSGGSIFKTTNGGTNWIFKQSNLTTKLNNLFFYPPNLFWAAGDAGKIIKSSSSGETWFVQNTNNSTVTFNDIFFPSSETGYAVSSEGVMYRTTNSGGVNFIQPISNEIPNQFSLSQNYPNPFNPTTKIKFSIPLTKGGERSTTLRDGRLVEGLSVQLKIYDILGKEITTLINEQLKPGTYEVEWDASNYSSGMYYYSLQTDIFKETKKMVLIK